MRRGDNLFDWNEAKSLALRSTGESRQANNSELIGADASLVRLLYNDFFAVLQRDGKRLEWFAIEDFFELFCRHPHM